MRKSGCDFGHRSGVLLLVGFAGSAFQAADLTAIGNSLAGVELGGFSWKAAYDIAKDPSSAPMEILGLVLGLGAFRLKGSTEKFAQAQKRIDVDKMGKTYKRHDKSLKSILSKCRKT
jgi:hypothetical protein